MKEEKREATGPIIIGATGGSGTRALANLLVESNKIYLGRNHNPAMDCLDFKPFYDEWITRLTLPLFDSMRPIEIDVELAATQSFEKCFESYLRQLESEKIETLWGWKGPRSMYLLPFFYAVFPALKFIHLVRDGRDMAYSSNQNQLNLYGETIINRSMLNRPTPVNSIALWSTMNMRVADYGREHLKEAYFCLRYEDMVFDRTSTLERLAKFLNIESEALLKKAKLISPNKNCGHWKSKTNDDHISDVVSEGADGLYYFTYR